MGATLGFISDILKIRTNPKVKITGMGGLAMTLRVVQTPKTFKFGIKNNPSEKKSAVTIDFHFQRRRMFIFARECKTHST